MQVSEVRIDHLPGIFLMQSQQEKAKLLSPVFDQPILPKEILQGLLQVQDLHGLKGHKADSISDGLTRYPLYSCQDGYPWAIELYDISRPLTAQLSKAETRMLFVVEGMADVQVDAHAKELQPGQCVRIYPESTYSITPAGSGCRFLLLCMSLPVPMLQQKHQENTEAIFADPPAAAIHSALGELQKECFPEICINGKNAAYDLIEGKTVGGRYNVSILDIVCARKHYHEQETERRVVLGGNLEVELDSRHYLLTFGQMCRISPMVVHRFKSQDQASPTRLFAINIPAYDPANVKLAE